MSPGLLSKLERLAAAKINLLPAEIASYFVFERDGFCALVERTEEGFGRIGSAGLLHEGGFAALLWRGDDAIFAGKGFERIASAQQVADLRAFQTDLQAALS